MQKGSVRLVRLGNQEVAGAGRRPRAKRVELAPDDHRRIQSRPTKHRRHQRCGRGLSVGAGDRDAILESHELPKHLGARNDWNAGTSRFAELGVGCRHRRGEHHDVRIAHILGFMADVDRGALFSEAPRVIVLAEVRSRDFETRIEEDLRNAAHPDAPYANEVYRPNASAKHGRLLPHRPIDDNRATRAVRDRSHGDVGGTKVECWANREACVLVAARRLACSSSDRRLA